ncbi:MAG TPA: cbb3-type cytochrome c oxidase subunit I [Tepidisphaeraceae bacterium]|nr:cbb3-type cytochrome c oxidase subunit I [Tepidisphaeraceae bacterium]
MSATALPFPADHSQPHAGHGHAPGGNYLTHGKGVMSWLFTLDHKRIAIMYMIAILASFFIGGVFAILLRTLLWAPPVADPNNAMAMRAATAAYQFYNHVFTLHGAVMVFMFIIPAVPAIMGNFVLPMQLGAKDVAFPRLNLLSFYCWLGGALFFVYVLISGVLHSAFGTNLPGGFGLDTGWTFYTPYSTAKSAGAVIPATLGAFILGFSSILTGLNFIATIHMLRPKGMTWFRMPLFLWATYSTSVIQVLATPVLAITLLLLIAERALGVGIFDPALGGDPVLYQHFFWFYSHPAVYIMVLPAMGVISELIAVFSRRHIFGYNFIAFSSIAIALLSFIVWGHHMFVSGQSTLANAIFSLLTFSVAIPSAIKVFNWASTLYKGDIRLKTPMLYALGFVMLFTIGGLTGLFLGALSVDVHLTDTYFVVAHFHYVMMGSTLFAFLGGMYYWWPKMFGKMYSEYVGRIAFVIIFVGFNLTFFPQFVMGSHGMPRRYASYPDRPMFVTNHRLSTSGAYIMASGLVLVAFNWVHSLRRGRRAPANPWGANTLEWRTPSPPPHDNFPGPAPVADDPYDFHGWKENPDGSWYLDEAEKKKYADSSHH